VDFFCGTLVGWFILKIAVMCLRTRQEKLAYLGDMYCRRIENLDRDASCT